MANIIGTVVKDAGSLMSRRSKMIMAGAAIAGVASAHPFQPISEAFQEEVYGDKDAFQKTISAAAVTGLRDAFAHTPAEQEKIAKLYQQSTTNGRQSSRMYGANGSIVFGLYNNRLGG